MQAGATPHPFWNFSLEVYSGEGVARSCIELQDRHGLDVNVLLFCCWIGASGRGRLQADELKRLAGKVTNWQREIVMPLRAARRRLAAGENLPVAPDEAAGILRRRVADAEIEAEHVEQLLLAENYAVPGNRDRPPKERLTAALANLGLYSEQLGIKVERRDRAAVATILAACFPMLDRGEIEHALNLDRA
jgi:uncharacterized protein (TIGR02444 family)